MPARSIATFERIDLRVKKFGGNTGGRVRARDIPLITLKGLISRVTLVLIPKGDASMGELASKNHPLGVNGSGEILKAGEGFFQHTKGIFK